MLALLLCLVLEVLRGEALREHFLRVSPCSAWRHSPQARYPYRPHALPASPDFLDVQSERTHDRMLIRLTKERPAFTRAVSSGFAYLLGDALSQLLFPSSRSCRRALAVAFFGFSIHAPLAYIFYTKLSLMMPGHSRSQVVKRVLTEQMLWSPFLSLVLIIYLGFVNKLSNQKIMQRILNICPAMALTSCSLWFPVHFLNYKIIPRRLKSFVFNCAQIICICILSKMTH